MNNRLSLKAFSLASALLWAGAVFFVALVHYFSSGYGTGFLNMLGSVYPGYQTGQSFADVLTVSFWALGDGLAGGFLFAWLYNFFIGKKA